MLLTIFQRGAFLLFERRPICRKFASPPYSFGLLSFMLGKYSLAVFTHGKTLNTRKFGIGVWQPIWVFNLILVLAYDYVGLAMATSIVSCDECRVLYWALHKNKVLLCSKQTIYLTC